MGATVGPARLVAYNVIRRSFEAGAFTDRAFRAEAERAGLAGRERNQAQRLAFGAVQRRGTADALIADLGRRDPEELDPPVRAALYLGIFELLYSSGTPDHAAINEAVELARLGGARRATGLVNALLRRLVRERAAIEKRLSRRADPADLARAESLPLWLSELWWRELGAADAAALAAAANRPAERALRINEERWSMEEAVAAAADAGIELRPAATPAAPAPLALPEMAVVEGSWQGVQPWLREGLATPQSRGSAAVVAILDPRPGEHVFDLCAGPGTKTGQIAARMRGVGELIAVEKDEGRAGETSEQLRRLGVHIATVVEADAARADLRGPGFDRVLLDAPCSDLGALNSRPDARWRKSPETIERLAELQSELLANAARHLAPGGILVYSTCTISRTENEEQVRRLLERSAAGEQGLPPLEADDLGAEYSELASGFDSRFLQIRPDRDGTTGFFIARLRRRPADRG